MGSRVQVLLDDTVKKQLDGLCGNLDLKLSAENRGRVVAYLIEQTKELVRLREQYATTVDERDSAKSKIEDLEFTIEGLQEEVADLKSAIKAHQRALVFSLDAAPKG